MDTELWTSSIDLTGLTDPEVQFNLDYYALGDYAAVNTSTDGGTTWANLYTWTAAPRGPRVFSSAIPGAGLNNVKVRWHYGNASWAWWWEVNSVEVTACEPTANPAIELNKTVGTTPGVSAAGDNITVSYGTEVYYCYQIQNTGDVALNFHDLDDSALGEILDDLPYALAPGAYSPQVVVPATPMATVTNVGTWTAVSALAGYMVDDTIAYNWQDISGTGTAIPLTDDSMSPAIPLGFAFDYFGTNYPNVYVSSNGFMTVLAGQCNGCCTGQPIPTVGDPDGVIAGWWEDLNLSAGGTVHYQTLGSAPNRVFIVQFTSVPHYSSGNDVTMQFKLFETTNVIEVHYQVAPSDGGTHSAGIENADGSAGVQWYYGTASLTTPEAVQYAPMPVYSATDTDTATVNVLLPNINVNPLSLSTTLVFNTSTTLPMTVANTGQGNLMWEITEVEPTVVPPGTPADPTTFERPVITSSKDCGPYMGPNAGPVPEGFLQYCAPAGRQPAPEIRNPLAPTDTAYSLELTTGSFFSFPLNNFGAQTGHGTQTRQIFAMDFNADATTMYAIDYATNDFGTLDLNTAAFTVIGTSTPLGGQSWTGLTIDPLTNQAYASSCDITSSAIYSVNLNNGATTLIGTTTDAPCLIDISISPDGDMYGHDIVNNSIYLVNRNTGAVTLVGPTGYDANYAQGMDFDNDTGTLYIFLFDFGSFGTIYGTVDLNTGAVTPLAFAQDLEYEGAVQNTSYCAAQDAPWLSLSPTTGTTAAGASTPVAATFNATGLAVGTYTSQLCIRSNDPDAGPGNGTNLVIVPVTLQVINQCPAGAVTGALTTTDPTFNRPVHGNPGCFPDPYVGTHVPYDVYSYNLTGPTPADVWASLCGSTAFNSVLVIYQAPNGAMHPFNPAQPCTNAVAYDDDFCQSQPLIDQATFGNGWIDIVVAGYANDGLGPYTLNLDSNSCNGGSAKINVSPLSVNNGQACMNQNTQVTQPMTVRNVGNRSLYTWAADSSNASCTSISNVSWLSLPEASFATVTWRDVRHQRDLQLDRLCARRVHGQRLLQQQRPGCRFRQRDGHGDRAGDDDRLLGADGGRSDRASRGAGAVARQHPDGRLPGGCGPGAGCGVCAAAEEVGR